jgi:hypothetical protein
VSRLVQPNLTLAPCSCCEPSDIRSPSFQLMVHFMFTSLASVWTQPPRESTG